MKQVSHLYWTQALTMTLFVYILGIFLGGIFPVKDGMAIFFNFAILYIIGALLWGVAVLIVVYGKNGWFCRGEKNRRFCNAFEEFLDNDSGTYLDINKNGEKIYKPFRFGHLSAVFVSAVIAFFLLGISPSASGVGFGVDIKNIPIREVAIKKIESNRGAVVRMEVMAEDGQKFEEKVDPNGSLLKWIRKNPCECFVKANIVIKPGKEVVGGDSIYCETSKEEHVGCSRESKPVFSGRAE